MPISRGTLPLKSSCNKSTKSPFSSKFLGSNGGGPSPSPACFPNLEGERIPMVVGENEGMGAGVGRKERA
jgi:hypothetical protein